ncbi:MAG: hypothetical protein IT322_08595 [Anaerolineae bacterium]|nr:hypothetical protein [Anaerolineae bacterium]
MPRPVTGRRPDSLFDNRYRYDHIYPRGRSGETLRAYDTQQGNAPVVIKRPALQDAPPIRAGQEVSILNEKRALEALSGHPVLAELLHSGIFRVGGQQHHYIVIEMATGETLESILLGLAAQGKRLPDLEMLNILDGLLDLLQAAHDRAIVYNDVDAKHLFWDREQYLLKLIDWGNAVFLDAPPPGTHVSRQTDIQQVGQLIYFLLSGGHRLDMGRPEPANELGEEVSPRLKAIINRAVSLEISGRYPEIAPLRQELAEVRRPIQKERDQVLERVQSRMTSATSKKELEELLHDLDEASLHDPGYPLGRELRAEVESRLGRIEMQSDLDAVRIYIESGNFGGASSLVDEMIRRQESAEPPPLLLYLHDVCDQLDSQPRPAGTPAILPEGLSPALDALFEGDYQRAGRLLVTVPESRSVGRMQQFLLAERLARRIPGVVLLRPHLVRLEEELSHTPDVEKLLQTARSLSRKLEAPSGGGLQPLRRLYAHTADVLSAVESELKNGGRGSLAEVATRARQAAEHVVELLEVAAGNALSDSSRAGNALWHAAAIDPGNPAFEVVNGLLNNFHADLESLRTYDPGLEEQSVGDYLSGAKTRLGPYVGDVLDDRFSTLVKGVEGAINAWGRLVDSIAFGGRRPAWEACKTCADQVRPLNPTLARLLDENARQIEDSPRVEGLSPNPVLGKALAEGWEAWDKGRGAEAIQAGKRAVDAAATDAEKLAARRLISLSEALDRWLDREGMNSTAQIESMSRRVQGLFLPEEESIRQTFGAQMPNMQVYLRAMAKGVVDPLRETSAAGVRLLFFDYVLRGMLTVQKEQFEEASQWKEAASKTLPNVRLHPVFQALEEAIVRRQLILEAVRALNEVRRVDQMQAARLAVRAPLASAQLEQADQAVRALEDALRRWQDGEFRAARQLLDSAIERINMAQGFLGKDLSPFRAWLQNLADSAEILASARRVIEQAALVPTDEPDPAVLESHQKLVEVTRRDLGEGYTAQIRQWYETYAGMLEAYTEPKLNQGDRLRLMDGYFASLFITRQPALPIFRHWRDVVEATPDPMPEPPPPMEDEEKPILPAFERDPDLPGFMADRPRRGRGTHRESEFSTGSEVREPRLSEIPYTPSTRTGTETLSSSEVDSQEPAELVRLEAAPQGRPSPLLVIGLIVVVGAIIGVLTLASRRGESGVTPTAILLTPDAATVVGVNNPSVTPLPATNTLEATLTPQPSLTPIPPTETQTPSPVPPTPTPDQPVPTPTEVNAASPVPTGELVSMATVMSMITPTLEPTLNTGAVAPAGTPLPTSPGVILPTVPPDAASGTYDLLAALNTLDNARRSWDSGWFYQKDGKWLIGRSEAQGGHAPLIRLGPDILTPTIGAEASQYLKRMDITLELISAQPDLIPNGLVYFGAGFESLQGQRASVEARLVQSNILDMGISVNARFLRKTQLPASKVTVNLGVERNPDRTLSLYLNGQLLGQSNAVFAPNVPLSLYLYTSTGGVVVEVKALTVQISKPN